MYTLANPPWQQVDHLHTVLQQSSDDLIEAVTAVLSCDTSCYVDTAPLWARIAHERRLTLLPIIAAVVEREFQQ